MDRLGLSHSTDNSFICLRQTQKEANELTPRFFLQAPAQTTGLPESLRGLAHFCQNVERGARH
jgi:hypothetical protein